MTGRQGEGETGKMKRRNGASRVIANPGRVKQSQCVAPRMGLPRSLRSLAMTEVHDWGREATAGGFFDAL